MNSFSFVRLLSIISVFITCISKPTSILSPFNFSNIFCKSLPLLLKRLCHLQPQVAEIFTVNSNSCFFPV
uniref:Secreted peptide n=1 Tax=Rhipicephalus pulchellus TaxID=72859 RepID=L7LXM3_RHIPC